MPRLRQPIREVVLTFDDGPSSKATNLILDTLAQHDVKAMFFVVGLQVELPGKTSIVRRAHDEGHLIGNHSYSHANFRGLDKEQVKIEIERTHELISDFVGDRRYFRPPGGAQSPEISEAVAGLHAGAMERRQPRLAAAR